MRVEDFCSWMYLHCLFKGQEWIFVACLLFLLSKTIGMNFAWLTFQALPVLYPPLRDVIGGLAFSQLIKVLRDLTSSESLSTFESLTLTCQNKVCVISVSLLFAVELLEMSAEVCSRTAFSFSLDCPCSMPSCPMERSCCLQVFP